MRYLTLAEVLHLHELIIKQTGGARAIRDLGALESAIAQPAATFGGKDLYPSIEEKEEKATALGFSIIMNHPFMDGNKRLGHAAMETFLFLNGFELEADVEDSERVFLGVAGGEVTRDQFFEWVKEHIKQR